MTSGPPSSPSWGNGLQWLRVEIVDGLERVRAALKRSDHGNNTQALREAHRELRQLSGVVAVLHCVGIALLLDEMQTLLKAVVDGEVEDPSIGLAALSAATFQLADYVEALTEGASDSSIALQPVINELRVVHAASVYSEAELCARQLQPVLADTQATVLDPPEQTAGDTPHLAGESLTAYQRNFVAWFKQPTRDAALAMATTAHAIAAAASDIAVRRLWWIFALLLESQDGLDGQGNEPSMPFKRLIGRSCMALQNLKRSGEATSGDADLAGQALYWLSRMPHPSAQAGRLVTSELLQPLLPDADTVEAMRDRLRAPDTSVMNQVRAELRRDLQEVEDTIDLAVRTHGRVNADLSPAADRLRRTAATLDTLGLPHMRQILDNQATLIPDLAPDAPQWIDVATALVRVQSSLDHALGVGLRQWQRDPGTQSQAESTPSARQQSDVAAFAKTALLECGHIEAGVTACTETGDAGKLAQLPPRLVKLIDGLRVADFQNPVAQLEIILRYVESDRAARVATDPAAANRLAQAFVAVELYLEGLRDGVRDRSALAAHMRACVEPLETALAAPDETAATPQQPAPAQFVAEAVIEEKADPEMVAIFLEETADIELALQNGLRALQRDSDNHEALTEIRRAFHTLKGSGRMVGATGIGEFAWAIEQLLNRCLDGTLALRRPILDTTRQAAALIPQLCEALKAGDTAASTVPEAEQLAGHADELRRQNVEQTSDLYKTFCDDARTRISLVQQWLAGQSAQDNVAVEPEVLRAFHTLRGSAGVAQVEPVRRLAGAAEAWLDGARKTATLLDADAMQLLADIAAALARWIEPNEIAEQADTECTALEARITSAHEALASPDAAQDHDLYTLEALQKLQKIDARIHDWCRNPGSDGAGISDACRASAAQATTHHCPALGESLSALAGRLDRLGDNPSPALLPALEDVLENLYQRLDAIRDSGTETDPATLLDQIAGLPIPSGSTADPTSAPNGQSASSAPVDIELLAIFMDEARELLDACATALNSLAHNPDDGEALDCLRRKLHTLKGSARMAGQIGIGTAAERAQQCIGSNTGTSEAVPGLRADLQEMERLWEALADTPGVHGRRVSEPAASAFNDTAPLEPGTRDEPEIHIIGKETTPEAESQLEVFLPEAAELLETLDAAVADWDDQDSLTAARRALHTLKGSARTVGLEAMGERVHALETELETQPVNAAALRQKLRIGVEDLHQIYDALQRGDMDALPGGKAATPSLPPPWTGGLNWQPEDEQQDETGAQREYARVQVAALDNLLSTAGEVGTQRARLVAHNASLHLQLSEMDHTVARVTTQLRQLVAETDAQIASRGLHPEDAIAARGKHDEDRYAGEFDALEMDRYSRMQELSRMLAEAVHDLGALHKTMDQTATETEGLLEQHGQLAASIQQGLMDTLLVPFSREQGRFERVVRQAARDTGKNAALHVTGAETELDRNVLQRLVGSVEHLLRNAVVHGIETPDARKRSAKLPEGQIKLRVFRDGTQIVLEVSDDGHGVDFQAIRLKAVERGLLTADAHPGPEVLGRLIFEPGFSTAGALTQEAGRGIGLDVVTATVRRMGGSVDLRAPKDGGATFILRLPLNLAVSQALLVGVGGERYMIPLTGVDGLVRIPQAELAGRLAEDGTPVEYGGQDYRVRYLGSFLGIPGPVQADARSVVALLLSSPGVLGQAGKRTALVVDEFFGTREVLPRIAGPQLANIAGISGAAVLPDGAVAISLDMAALSTDSATPALAAKSPVARETVMVVDDSITMRRIAERLLTRHGYRVVTARDGLVAMDLLRDETPAIVLLDIEMPGADGFEVASFIRNDARISELPIIMITSRSGDKHRERAERIGVNHYLIKPYQEQELLQKIARLSKSAQRVPT